MINIFTDGWLISSESEHFVNFSELSDAEKRIQHLIDDIRLPYRQMYRIYQKDKNIVVAIKELQWKFAKNRFFIKTTFDTLATITPTRVYSTNIHSAACFVCKHLGFEPHIHINKILLRQIVKNADVNSFVTVTDISEVIGHHIKKIPRKRGRPKKLLPIEENEVEVKNDEIDSFSVMKNAEIVGDLKGLVSTEGTFIEIKF